MLIFFIFIPKYGETMCEVFLRVYSFQPANDRRNTKKKHRMEGEIIEQTKVMGIYCCAVSKQKERNIIQTVHFNSLH